MYLFLYDEHNEEEEDKAIWQRCAQIISTPINIINILKSSIFRWRQMEECKALFSRMTWLFHLNYYQDFVSMPEVAVNWISAIVFLLRRQDLQSMEWERNVNQSLVIYTITHFSPSLSFINEIFALLASQRRQCITTIWWCLFSLVWDLIIYISWEFTRWWWINANKGELPLTTYFSVE